MLGPISALPISTSPIEPVWTVDVQVPWDRTMLVGAETRVFIPDFEDRALHCYAVGRDGASAREARTLYVQGYRRVFYVDHENRTTMA